ncbi:MAG: prepilin peptidase [Deltaproteobacteria bacterium]|nr:prepilin peptidase [Deltaproteobacteria bacterium]NIS76639.1 prepilin peptidase [Deltaproteobacteria bacterium]
MESLTSLFFFLLGTVMGSFYNVIIHRLPEGRSIVRPPSSCPSCESKIQARDNVPILSYLLLKGRCRNCGVRISSRYPFVELCTGLIFFLAYRFDGITFLLLRDLLFYSILFVVTFIDIDKRIIPDTLSLGGLVAGFFIVSFLLGKGWKFSATGIVVGGGILYFTALIYEGITKREGLGGGDIKLLGMVGAFTGYKGAILTIFIGSVIGTLFGVYLMVKEKGDLKTAVPFGPFLAGGAVISDIILRSFAIQFFSF